MDEAGGLESSLVGALAWLAPPFAASLTGRCGRTEIAEVVNTDELVL